MLASPVSEEDRAAATAAASPCFASLLLLPAALLPCCAPIELRANSLPGGTSAQPNTSYGKPFVNCSVGLMCMEASSGSRALRSVPGRGTSTRFCVVK